MCILDALLFLELGFFSFLPGYWYDRGVCSFSVLLLTFSFLSSFSLFGFDFFGVLPYWSMVCCATFQFKYC